ncbi:hypothetical protein Leryth_026221 [Lithospermum erythrorhizon]|nr:hypothetical protein Leryth_026221 [Lithospermum erythrorhizon]
MFKSKSKNNQKQLRFGDGRGRLKSKAPSKTCKKHAKHEQSPGVCAVCLREKLTHLPTSSSKLARGNNVVSSSISSYLSSLSSQDYSSNVSSCSSPINYRRSYSSLATFSMRGKKNYHENTNMNRSSKNVVFSKNRSLAFLMQKPRLDETVDKNDGKKKQGFWSKLLRSRTRNKEDHHGTTKSRTLKESRRS